MKVVDRQVAFHWMTRKDHEGLDRDFGLRKLWIPVLLLFAVLAVLTYLPVVTGKVPLPANVLLQFSPWSASDRPTPSSVAELGDLVTQAFPFRWLDNRSMRALALPLWNPYLMSGSPFIANAQSAFFYPLNAINYLFHPFTGWSLGLVLRVFLAAIFMTLFVTSIGGSRTGAILAGILFGWCGFITTWQGWPIGDSAIWLPLMFYSAHRLYQRPDGPSIGIAAMSFAMPVLAGHPETALHMTLATSLYAAALASGDMKKPGGSRRFTLAFASAGLLALGFAAIQILPTIEWIGQVEGNLSTAWPTLPVWQALGFLSRDIRHQPNASGILIPEAASYLPMIALLLAPLSAFSSAKRHVVPLALLAVVAFMIAFSINPIHWVIGHTPLLEAVKNGRLILVTEFCLAALSGLGFSIVQEQLDKWGRRRVCVVLVAALLFALASVYALQRSTNVRVDVMARPSFSRALLVIAAVVLATAIFGRLRGRVLACVVCTLAIFDGVTFAYGYTGFVDRRDIYPSAPVFDFLKTHLSSSAYRVAALSDAYPENAPLMYGLPAADGYDIPLHRLWLFTETLRSDRTGIKLTAQGVSANRDRRLDLLNVKYLVGSRANAESMRFSHERFPIVFEHKDLVVFENKSVLPQVFAVPQSGIEVIPGADDQFARLTTPEFKPEQSVILSSPAVVTAIGENREEFQSHLVNEQRTLNGISVEARVNRPAVLVVSQPFYPGWRATVDGSETSVLDADLALTAVLVPSGTHHVRLTFYSPSFRLGALLSVLALAGVAASFVRLLRRVWLLRIGIGAGMATIVAAGLTISANPRLSTPNGLAKTTTVQIISTDHEKTLQVLESDSPSGYAQLQQNGSRIAGLVVLRHKEKESLSETVLQPSVPATNGLFPFRLDDHYRPAVVIVNDENVPLNFAFSVDSSLPRRVVIPAKHQLAVFLDEHPFEIDKSTGTFIWNSDVPVAVAAVQTFHDSSHSFLMAAIPISSPAALVRDTILLPSIGEKSEAELVMMNPMQGTLTGHSVWHNQSGKRTQEMAYSIAPSMTARRALDLEDGWLELIPDRGQSAPDATLFAMTGSGLTRSLVSIRGVTASTEARLEHPLLADTSLKVAVINPSPNVAHLDTDRDRAIPPLSVSLLDGRSISRRWRSDIPIAFVALRTKYVNGNEYITSSYPAPIAVSVFPHFSAGGPFSTEFLFVAPAAAKDLNGTLHFFGSNGQPVNVGWRWHY